MTDAIRKQFEAALSDYFERLELNHNPNFERVVVGASSVYADKFTAGAEFGYLAAKSEPIILPSIEYFCECEDGCGCEVYMRNACDKVLTAQGYQVKES